MRKRSAPSALEKQSAVSARAERLLARLGGGRRPGLRTAGSGLSASEAKAVEFLVAADLLSRAEEGKLKVTEAGLAHLARRAAASANTGVDPFLVQHVSLARGQIETESGPATVMVNESESPLAWLARRRGRDGRALIEPVELQAGERLRAQFTRALLTPRVTAGWDAPIAAERRSGGGAASVLTETVIAARQQVRNALDTVGPEFAGLLLDVCCFLKRLEDVEHERGWPSRSAKVVLQLALARLARHYGLAGEARGRGRAKSRAWQSPEGSASAGGRQSAI
jgi:hypothetical protein